LQASLQSSESRVDQARVEVIEELRTSLEETTELLFGSVLSREDAEAKTLDRIAQRWERIGQSMDNTFEGRLVQAEALLRLGSIHAILGDAMLADRKLRQSLELLENLLKDSPRSSQIRLLMAEASNELGKNLYDNGKSIDSENAFLQAIEHSSHALQIDPSDQSAALLLARVRRHYGVMLERSGNLNESARQLDEAMSTLDRLPEGNIRPTSLQAPSVSRDQVIVLAWSINNAKAMLLRKQGEANKASRLLEDLSETFKELSIRKPEDPIIWRLMAVQRFTLGLCQMDLARFEQAQESILNCRRLLKRLIALQPRLQEHRKNNGVYLGLLGIISLRLNNPNQAIEHLIEAVQVHSELASEYPNQTEYIHEKCKAISNLVAVLSSVNRFEEAISYGVELLQIESKLCRDYPDQTEYAYALAVASHILGFSHAKLGQYQEANAMLKLSEATYLDLIDQYPKDAMYYAGKIKTGLSVAELASLEQDWHVSIDTYTTVIQEVLDHSSSPPMDQSILLAKAYLGQALAFKALGRFYASRICAEIGRSTVEPWKDKDAVCKKLYLQCSEVIK
jgi:tetratricopeptide (TPR) repeat protein